MHIKVKKKIFEMYTIDIVFARRICKQNKVYCFTFCLIIFSTNSPFPQTKKKQRFK